MPATVMKRGKKKGPPSSSSNGGSVGNCSESAMDDYLKAIDLYRKSIAKDGSCLFRAVSEQVYHCQSKHLQVRKECIEFMRKNREKFEEFIEGPFDHHLFKLQNPKEWAGQVEISALSLMYKKDFVVYQDVNFEPTKVTDNGFGDKIMLCFSNGNHYDAVYTQRFKRNASLCQAIIYDLLYSNVFSLLGKKESRKAQQQVKKEDEVRTADMFKNGDTNDSGHDNEQDEGGWTTVQSKSKAKSARQNKSFPEHEEVRPEETNRQQNNLQWEINRSISLDYYRNVELEAWEEAKHNQQQKDWAVANTIQYRKNDRCLAQLPIHSASPDKIYTVIINDVNLEKQSAAVFVPELKERMVISLQNLKPQEISSDSSYRELSGYYKKTESNGPVSEDGEKYRKKSDRRPRPRRNYSRSEDQGEDGNPRRGATQDEMPQRPRPGSGRDRMNKRRFGGRSREDRRAQEDEEEKRFIAEQTKLIELQEKDPKAFPALPSVQDTKSPRPKSTAPQESQPVQPQEKVVPPPAPVPPPDDVVNQSPAAFWSRLKAPKQVSSQLAKDLSSTSFEQPKDNAIPSVDSGQQSLPLVEELETKKGSDSQVMSKTADQINKTSSENDFKSDLIDTEGLGDNSSKESDGLHDAAVKEKEKLIKAERQGTKFDGAMDKIVNAPVVPNRADLEELTRRRISIEVKNKPEELPKTISLPPGGAYYEQKNIKSQSTRVTEIPNDSKELKSETFMQSPFPLKQTVETELTFHTEPPKTIEELVKSNPPKRFEKETASKEKLPNKKTEGPQIDLTKLNNSPKNENVERTEGLTPKSIIMTSNGNNSSKLEKKTVTFQVPPDTTERINSFESDKQVEGELSSPVSGQKPIVSGQAVNLNAGAPRQPNQQFVKREPGILPVSSLPSPLGTENKGFVENEVDKPNLAPSDSSHVPETVSVAAPIPNNLDAFQNLKQSSSPVEMDGSPSPDESTSTSMSSLPQVPGTQSQHIGYMQYGPMLTMQLDANELPTDINTLKFFYNLGVQYYMMHGSSQPMMVYPVFQEHLQPQAQTPVSLGQQHFTGSQQSVFYSHQPPVQQYSHQPVHIPPVSQEGTSYSERNNAERPIAAVQQPNHSLPVHQQVPFHAPVMNQNWRQQRPQQTFGNANFGHQNKSMHGYQHQNSSFQTNRQTHPGSQYSKPRDGNSGHKKHPKKQQHYRNDIHSQNPYTANSPGGQQIHTQPSNATMTGAQPFSANVAAATGNPVVASNNYFVGGDHLQGNKSPGEYYGQGNQPYRQYQHGMSQAPHSAPSSRSPYTQ